MRSISPSCSRWPVFGMVQWVCLGYIPKDPSATPSVVSIGSRGDPSFEQDANHVLGSVADTFDPFIGPPAERFMRNLSYVQFHSMGLTGESELAANKAAHPNVQWATVATMLDTVGHPDLVDVFKIDCEVSSGRGLLAQLQRPQPVGAAACNRHAERGSFNAPPSMTQPSLLAPLS